MALGATHLRFAQDFLERLGVKNLGLFYAGALYPDSRYVTGIHRNLTHGDGTPHDPFDPNLDDFQKGWAAHIVYDELGIDRYKALSPWPNIRVEGFSDLWVYISAEKIIEDMQSYELIKDLPEILASLEYPKNLNGEDRVKLKKYFDDTIKFYGNLPQVDDYGVFLNEWNIPKEVQKKLLQKAKEMEMNQELTEKVRRMYRDIVVEVMKEESELKLR